MRSLPKPAEPPADPVLLPKVSGEVCARSNSLSLHCHFFASWSQWAQGSSSSSAMALFSRQPQGVCRMPLVLVALAITMVFLVPMVFTIQPQSRIGHPPFSPMRCHPERSEGSAFVLGLLKSAILPNPPPLAHNEPDGYQAGSHRIPTYGSRTRECHGQNACQYAAELAAEALAEGKAEEAVFWTAVENCLKPRVTSG